jgi:hypothetical protein
MVRATLTAETILETTGGPESESPLPESIPEVVLRPLTRLSSELQGPVWKLASLVSPERTPTQATTAKLVRLVEGAISEGYAKKNGQTPAKPKPEPPRERVFFGAITRLSKIDYISEIICLNIADKARAEKFAASCQEASEYCQAVKARTRPALFAEPFHLRWKFRMPRFPRQTYNQCKRRRQDRIRRRAVPELSAAMEHQKISLRRAEALSRLSPKLQKKELARELRESSERSQGQRLAAEVIERFLAGQNGSRIDLGKLAFVIREAICGQ